MIKIYTFGKHLCNMFIDTQTYLRILQNTLISMKFNTQIPKNTSQIKPMSTMGIQIILFHEIQTCIH